MSADMSGECEHGPWIPGWNADQTCRPQNEPQQQQQQQQWGLPRWGPPWGQQEDRPHQRVPCGPYWAGEQPPPPEQQHWQDPAQDDNRRRRRRNGDQQQWPPGWRSAGGYGEAGGGPPRHGGRQSAGGQEGDMPSSDGWWSLRSRDQVFGPPDGAETGTYRPQQGPMDPSRSRGGQGPQKPAEEPQASGWGRHWGGALIGAGVYGLWRVMESITPPGWM